MDEFEAMALAAAAKKQSAPAPQNPAASQIKALTDQAMAAYQAGDEASGKALLVEASRLSADSGMAPQGMTADPRTGGMVDLGMDPTIPEGAGTAFGIGSLQGLGFGGGDEAVGGIAGAVNALGMGNGTDSRFAMERMRETERRAIEDNAAAYYSGFVPGAVASSVTAGKALGVNPQGANMLGTMGRGSAIGATEGAVYGGLSGEGLAGRAGEAVKNAALGGFIGGAAPGVVAAGRKVGLGAYDVALGGVDAALGKANQGRANRALIETLMRSGSSADNVADDVARAATQGQPEYRMMDAMGQAGQRRASGIVRAGGDGAEEIAQFLQQRQLDQPDRVVSFIDDAFGSRGTTAAQTKESLTAARGAAADTAYAAARGNAAPVDIRGAVQAIDDRVGPMRGQGVALDGIDKRLEGFRNRLMARNPAAPNSSVELSDFDRVLGVKQDLGDAIGEAVRAGRNNEARELMKVQSQLDAALEGSSGAYRAANDGFRDASRVIDSVDEGAAMAVGGRLDDTVPAFQAKTPDQQGAARIGYADTVIGDIQRNKATTANAAKQFASTKRAAEADAMALDPQLFKERLGRENTMWETQNRALGGSRTADNLQDVNGVGIVADIGRAARSGLTGLADLALTGAARMGNAATGQNEATRKLIAQMLMSQDPRATLAPALRSEVGSQARRRIAETVLRALGREATN